MAFYAASVTRTCFCNLWFLVWGMGLKFQEVWVVSITLLLLMLRRFYMVFIWFRFHYIMKTYSYNRRAYKWLRSQGESHIAFRVIKGIEIVENQKVQAWSVNLSKVLEGGPGLCVCKNNFRNCSKNQQKRKIETIQGK